MGIAIVCSHCNSRFSAPGGILMHERMLLTRLGGDHL